MRPWQLVLLGVVLLVGVGFVPAPTSAQPVMYTFDTAESWLVVKLTKTGIAAALAHDHAVRASTFSGSITYDPNDASACRVEITIPVEELVVDEPADRQRLDLEDGPGEKNRAKIKKSMLSKKQLWADEHPTITYQSTKCEVSGDQMMATGNLTIRGVTKEITTPLRIGVEDARFTVEGQFTVHHTDFDFKPYSAALGTIKNANPLEFHLSLVAIRQ